MQRLGREWRDLLECILIPGLAAVLPWRCAFWLFRQLSRLSSLYPEVSVQTLAAAREAGFVGDAQIWLRERRVVAMVDHADFYLALTRSDRWMHRHLMVEGHWPAPREAGLLCTFHWGAGMWGLRHAGAHGMTAHPLVAALDPAHFKGRWIYYHYIRWRNRAVSRALGTDTLEVGTSMRPVLKAFKAGEQVLAAIDVPSDQVTASESIPFLGRRARVPRGLLRVAATQGIPVTVYLTGLCMADGKRFLRIIQVGVVEDLDTLMGSVFGHLEAAIREAPVLWHFWAVTERFFER